MTLTLASLGILLFTLNTIKCCFYFILYWHFIPTSFVNFVTAFFFTKDNNKQTNWKCAKVTSQRWQMIMPHDHTFKYTSELFLAKSACPNLILTLDLLNPDCTSFGNYWRSRSASGFYRSHLIRIPTVSTLLVNTCLLPEWCGLTW